MATEYISREAAMSMPWANGQYDHEHANEHFICGLETYKEWLEQIPAADVRPVVLCRDCKHFNPYPGDYTDGGIEGVCKRHNSIGVLVMDEDFCSDAERI